MLPQKLLRALQSVTIMPINRKQNETTVLLRLMIQELKSQINTTTNSKLLGATSVQRENLYLAIKKPFLLTLNLDPIIRFLASPRAFCTDVQKILSRTALVTYSLSAAWQLSPSTRLSAGCRYQGWCCQQSMATHACCSCSNMQLDRDANDIIQLPCTCSQA